MDEMLKKWKIYEYSIDPDADSTELLPDILNLSSMAGENKYE
jgi:hypothetical protein